MRLEQSFEVPVPVAQAWAVLLDLELVAPCMPGATLTSFDGNAFTGTVKVKLGPISLAYRGRGRITERDESSRRIAFVAQGQDSRGAGGASARVSAVLHSAESGASTVAKVVTDLDISGKAAQFGRGMIADVSGKVIKQFADNLAAAIASGAEPAAPAAASVEPAAQAAAPAAVTEPSASAAVTEPSAVPAPELTPIPAAEQLAVVAPIPTPAPPPAADSIPAVDAPAVDAVPVPDPPALATVFTEPDPPAPVMPVFPPPPAGWRDPTAAPAAEPEPVAAAEPEPVAPPTPAYSAPPEYHPLALMDPEPETTEPEPAATTEPEPAAVPPVAAPVAVPPAAAPPAAAPASSATVEPTAAQALAPGSGLRRPPVEAEPLDLLAVSGAKGMMRRAAPVLIIVGLIVVALIVWLAVG